MEEKDKKVLWHCANCDYEGPEDEFRKRPDYRSYPKCRGAYVYSLEANPVWSCAACNYKGPDIELLEEANCHICPKCKSQDVFLDCDWQRLVDAENKTEKPNRDCEFDD